MRLKGFVWLVLMVVVVGSVQAQSLSFVRKTKGELWLESALPPNESYNLQASENLHLWVDINEDVQNGLSLMVDSVGVTNRYYRLTPWTESSPAIRIVLLGDSTVMDGPGWGKGLYGYFKPSARIVNLAAPAYSTKVFLKSEQYTTMLAIKPNFVLAQFGYTDSGGTIPEQTYTTIPEFRTNIVKIIQSIQGFNGIPILVTPPVQRVFDTNGAVSYLPLQERYDVLRELAVEYHIPLVDLNKLSRDLVNQWGSSRSADLYWQDGAHFTDKGAQLISRLVVNALPDNLGSYLTGIFEPPLYP